MTLTAPFPWFGGKSRAADLVWKHLGPVGGYVEPFAGSIGVLLGRPTEHSGVETINDIDGFIVNFWRAVQRDPLGPWTPGALRDRQLPHLGDAGVGAWLVDLAARLRHVRSGSV